MVDELLHTAGVFVAGSGLIMVGSLGAYWFLRWADDLAEKFRIWALKEGSPCDNPPEHPNNERAVQRLPNAPPVTHTRW